MNPSAAVNDAIASGVPAVVTDIGSFSEFPDLVVTKVAPTTSAGSLADVIVSIAADETRRAVLSAASSAYARNHSFASAAKRLLDAVLG